MDLSGSWHAAPADDELRRAFAGGRVEGDAWVPVPVPGHWASVPELADAEGPILYRRSFTAPPPAPDRRTWLVLDGVLYQGDVWLDGRYLGDTEGYFFPHSFEITELLAARPEHDLGVEVSCAPQRDGAAKHNLTGSLQHSPWLDPDVVPGGIWRGVRVHDTGPVRILHARVRCVEATHSRAVLAIRAVVDSDISRTVVARTTVTPASAGTGTPGGGTDHELRRPLAAGENRLEWTVEIADPARWWPHALGDQPLHDVTVAVHAVPDEHAPALDHPVSDEHRVRTGLRSVAMDRWIVRVNGERLFCKGTNLVPTRQLLAEATPEEVAADVHRAREANLDLVRVHAHVARPELYDTADAIGLLVWQDLPLQWGYARSVRRQAVRQAREAVDLLAHHPAVALWCGHNEPGRLAVWDRVVLDRSVRRTLRRTDGSRPVVPHSGASGRAHLSRADAHVRFGWEHGSIDDLAAAIARWPSLGRFVSELGVPAVPTTDGFCAPDMWPHLDWERLERHHGLDPALLARWPDPDTHPSLASWRDTTQAYQAELLGRQIEALRRLKYRPTGGFAQFFLADAHPAISPSVLDHARVPKAGWDALVAACRPVIVTADPLPRPARPGTTAAIDVHVVSDLRRTLPGATVTSRLTWPGGEEVRRWGADVPADSCHRVATLVLEVPDADGDIRLELDLVDADGTERCRRTDIVAIER